MIELEQIARSYSQWLNEQMKFRIIGEYIEITTPFLDCQNDWIQLYVKKTEDERYLITDRAYTLQDLYANGFQMKEIETILKQYDIVLKDDEITATATKAEFPATFHKIIQGILALSNSTICIRL